MEVFCSYQQQSTLIIEYLNKLKEQWSSEYMMISGGFWDVLRMFLGRFQDIFSFVGLVGQVGLVGLMGLLGLMFLVDMMSPAKQSSGEMAIFG